jgi:pSer/pThr/pTyr-binding forkhead associated (FHA) protein
MTLRLTVVAGADNGRSFVLSEGQVYVIGRGNDAQVQITDPRISRQHCQIDLTVNNGKLVDLNSTGGTFLNGEKIADSALNEGDRIQIGDSEMVFQGDVAAQTTLTSRPTAEPVQEEFPVKDLSELVGKTIHHFRIEKKIAEGASGVVFTGTDEKKQRPVAVKVLWPELSKDEESARRFVRGMKAMFPIRHPNIVRLYSAGMYKNLCWVAMEYIEGEDLTKVIERIGTAGMLDWQFGYRVAVQIGRALAAAYEH